MTITATNRLPAGPSFGRGFARSVSAGDNSALQMLRPPGLNGHRLPSFGALFRLVDRGAVPNRAAMTLALLIEQIFNGVQFGLMLFLMAVGVTLVFGIMRVINLADAPLSELAQEMASAKEILV